MEREGVDFQKYFEEINRRKLSVKWHMTWLLSHYVEQNRDEGSKAQYLIWKLLKDCDNQSVQRDLWRTLTFVALDEDIAGEVFDAAMQVIPSRQSIAVRAHAMFTARNVALPYAELRRELALVLEGLGTEESAAIRARSKNILKELRKIGATP